MSNPNQILDNALDQGRGVVRLSPTWVPRSFCIPGRRLKLHPDDYYAFGAHRGGIDERWFSSTTRADNGPETLPDEGLSYIWFADGGKAEKVLLKDAIESRGDDFLGPEVMKAHGGWTMYSKFFDNLEPLPHHLHHNDEMAAKIGQRGKPEAYYFPPQLNNKRGYFPYTFFGINPGVKKEQVRDCLANWNKGDNGILDLSRAYRLTPGTGWDVPPGLLHAPGSFLTYEPQRASDVFSMFQSIVWDAYTPWELLVKDVPDENKNDLDFIMSLVDWELNVDPNLYQNRFSPPKPVRPVAEMTEAGYQENWISYKSDAFSAKELTVHPNRTVRISDDNAYGLIVVQGHGRCGSLSVSAPTMIRFGQMTEDELFVTRDAARQGVEITNQSEYDDLVILKHFGPQS
ncbi:MAG: hypothetical protein EA384_05410 [Spirochaetaceae bacterium]|nr:MAG: hypothetical protein EA384_05410 [Spirochaetaceae bacterium]